ncbi:CRISPR-associated helicase Cas3' [Silvanigrella aquatica]|uniref:CRISPR-associated helicase Cas3 n=1 Tax=Silvanigrella aquatica TaxID=1915309 RepID=A0A1L4CXY5_9BACT|nr:CRISPR-associated helicase Cas3' [Silvanigrella aquatica]APJ02805.1 hypothetical protein AXG55_02235 [Silvanigrella aquatica]
MVQLERDLFLGCAKKNSDKEFHGILYHLLDAGACCLEIISKEKFLVNLIAPFLMNKYNYNVASRILSFFTAVHDLGKLSPVFQAFILKNEPHSFFYKQWQSSYKYWNDINKFILRNKDNFHHGYISTQSLLNYFYKKCDKLNIKSAITRFLVAIGHHHDKFHSKNSLDSLHYFNEIRYFDINESYCGLKNWELLRENFIDEIWRIIVGDFLHMDQFIDDFHSDNHELTNNYEVIFAGLACVSDWIASNENFFPYEAVVKNSDEIKNYFFDRRSRAQEVLQDKLYWGSEKCRYFKQHSFKNIFGFNPRSFQEQVFELVKQCQNPSLTIIEAPMGLGKTEAALSFLMSPYAQQSRGLYFALPTQATSNQMFTRINTILEKLFELHGQKVQLQILHSNKNWNDTNIELMKNYYKNDKPLSSVTDDTSSTYDNDTYDDINSNKSTLSSPWYENSRTGLLAEFGVGTIDQVLNCVFINSKHYFVKLFGLAGKTIILDEIHAYDAYMDEAICKLLQWLGHNQCQIILLSATLPKDKRDKFLTAFNNKQKIISSENGFPRITNVSWNKSDSFKEIIASSIDTQNKKTPTKLFAIANFKEIVAIVKNNIKKINNQYYGNIGIVCNTVNTAQKLFEEFLNDDFSKEDLLLFHARFSLNLKTEKESFIKESLGKEQFRNHINNLKSSRPKFKIIIATQVIEQSLDIDFDYMYSFLCPIDLLLQRMGRHFRRCRWDLETAIPLEPTQFGIFHEACDDSHLPLFELCRGTKNVYFESVLLKSYLVLKDFLSKNNNIIDDICDLEFLVQSVYSNSSEQFSKKRIIESEKEMFANNVSTAKKALSVTIDSPMHKKNYHNWFMNLFFEREDKVGNSNLPQTRLFNKTEQLILIIKHNNKNYTLNYHNKLVELPHLFTEEKEEIINILHCQITVPFYVTKDLNNSDVENLDSHKVLKHYKILNMEWNGKYAVKNLENTEIRYCSHYGFKYTKNKKS